jgi:hypothetical protein
MRLHGYQAGPRWQGVRLNIALIASYLDPLVKTAVDVGSNEGIITCALGELGIEAKGFEQAKRYHKRAVSLSRYLNRETIFENKLVTLSDIDDMGEVDAIIFLSVHHQIAAQSSLEEANHFLRALCRKAKHQLFFQPACIQAKYSCDVPFLDNDYCAIEAYFNNVVKDEMPHSKTVGFAQNDMPKSEPLRPMIVYSRDPTIMREGRDIAGILKVVGTAVDKVHSLGNRFF